MVLKIAISSQKGGVAKTTTSLTLGACLAEQGRSVLLVDLDPQANLTQSLGVEPERLRRTVGDALLEQASLLSVSRESAVFNLDLAPANAGLLVLDKVLYGRPGYEYRLKRQVQALTGGYYEVVIFDCPPALGTLTLNALTAADLLIIPVACEYYAARSLRGYLEVVRLVQRNTNPGLTYRLLVTLFDRRQRVSQLILGQLRQAYGAALFETLIPVDVRVRESPILGQPVTRYAPTTRAALGYRALALEVMAHAKA